MGLAFAPASALSLALLSAGAIGCAVPSDTHDESTADALGTQSAALVHVERQDGSSHAVARYVHAAHVTAEALRATGGAFELPAIGQCSPLESHAGARPLLPVELIAAGSTSLGQAGTVLELVPRSVPDVSDLVSGFVYTHATRGSVELAAGPASLVLAGIAEPLAIDLPPSLADVTVDGARAQAGPLDLDPARALVHVGWATAPLGSSPERLVVVDVHGATSAVRCTLEDSGGGEIDGSFFGPHGTLVLRRVVHVELEREPFQRIVIDTETSRTLSYDRAPR